MAPNYQPYSLTFYSTFARECVRESERQHAFSEFALFFLQKISSFVKMHEIASERTLLLAILTVLVYKLYQNLQHIQSIPLLIYPRELKKLVISRPFQNIREKSAVVLFQPTFVCSSIN